MYDICAHSSLPTSAIFSTKLAEKEEENEQFCVGSNKRQKTLIGISGTSQALFSSFKFRANADTTVENAYTVIIYIKTSSKLATLTQAMSLNSSSAHTDEEKANLFNQFFFSVSSYQLVAHFGPHQP